MTLLLGNLVTLLLHNISALLGVVNLLTDLSGHRLALLSVHSVALPLVLGLALPLLDSVALAAGFSVAVLLRDVLALLHLDSVALLVVDNLADGLGVGDAFLLLHGLALPLEPGAALLVSL